MKHIRLRYKMLLGALLLVVAVSVAITLVVSMLVVRQNTDSVHVTLEKSLLVIQDQTADRQQSFGDAIQHMAGANKLGEDVKFLMEFSTGDLSMTGNSYAKIGRIITNTGIVEKLYFVHVYSLDGNLVSFFERMPDQNLVMGFLHQGGFHFRMFQQEATYEQLKMQQTQQMQQIDIATTYSGSVPTAVTSGFTVAGGQISLETMVPVYANVYDRELEKSVPKQFGFVRAVTQLDQGFVAQMDRITGMQMNLFVKDKFAAGDLDHYTNIDLSQIPQTTEPGWHIKNQALYFSDIVLGDTRYYQALLPLYQGTRQIGAMAVLQSDAIVKANARQMIVMISLVALACVILVVPLAWIASGRVVNPLIRIVDKLKDIAEGEGDVTTRLEVTSKDEIGQVAGWFNTFINKIHTLIQDVAVNATTLNQSSATLKELSTSMSGGAEQTSDRAGSVSAASEEMSAAMTSVAAAIAQSSNSMGTISDATGEMTHTITEISKNAMEARQITEQVVEKTRHASVQVGELGKAADEIGHVVETITDISGQVNLLALNATIEAARAGEAGKGFAVVANEIKGLAFQTANASHEIKEKVTNIRQSTDRTVEQIDGVSGVVNKVSEIVLVIAAAVEEQSTTTRNMSENIFQVSEGIDRINTNISQSSSVSAEIAKDITSVTQAAKQMSENATSVDTRSEELSDLAQTLMALVKKFKI
jgi:methyl-accepting chemotaxis protein